METGRDTSGAEMEAILHEARAKEELAREMSKLEPYGEEEAAGGGETRVFSPARDVRPARQPLQAEEDSQARDWPEQAIAQKEASATAEPLKMSADVDKDMEPSSTASPGEYEEVDKKNGRLSASHFLWLPAPAGSAFFLCISVIPVLDTYRSFPCLHISVIPVLDTGI